MSYQHVYFRPWIGDLYGRPSSFGVPVLILGESHYGEAKGDLLPADLTQSLTRRVVETGWRHSFWTRCAGLVDGEWPTDERYRAFWNNVAFYNYIQEAVGEGARIRPDAEMWDKAALAFTELLGEIKPTLVVALGRELWRNLEKIGSPGLPLHVGERSIPTLRFQVGKAEALAVGIAHPASFGWRYEDWTPVVQASLDSVCTMQTATRNGLSPRKAFAATLVE